MLDRKRPPEFHTDFSYPLLHPVVVATDSNINVNIISSGKQDVVKLDVILNAGKWYEDSPAVSQLAASMINKGTEKLDSLEISRQFDHLGVHYDATAGYDFTTLTVYGLPGSIIKILKLFTSLIEQPIFPEGELEVLKSQFTQSLRINLKKNSYVAGCRSRELLFGSQHPYGRDVSETDIESIDQIELVDFHNKRFGINTVFLSGRITTEVEHEVLNAFNNSKLDSASVLSFDVNSRGGDAHFDKSGSLQTSIRFAKKTIGRTSDDYPALLLLNHILGGYFGSRLMKNIREEKGLTYGIHSSIHALRHASYFSIATDVKKENKSSAVDEIKRELDQLCTEMIPDLEFITAKNHFIGSLHTELSTPFAHADKARNIILHGLKPTFYSELLDKVNSLTPRDLLSCTQKHLATNSMSVVSVG